MNILRQQILAQPQRLSVVVPNGVAIGRVLERMSARRALSSIKDPAVWQRDIRVDRSLLGRDA
jgi:hypothetical protein